MEKKYKTSFMNIHPLRETLEEKDWSRIQFAFDNKNYDDVTFEEVEALNDVLYDSIAGSKQTHPGVLTLQ